MQKRNLLALLAVGLIVAVTGCAEGEPETAGAPREANEPRNVEVTHEVPRVVEKPARGTVEATRLIGGVLTASPPTTSRLAVTAAPSPSLAIESSTADAIELSDG
jgi:hypothetical protein